jgi:TraM recognition site of TraD and TraG
VVNQVRDPVVRTFWRDEFEEYDKRFRQEAISPIQNEVGQLLMSPPMRNVLGQVRRKVDSRFIMDKRKIFIGNLSKGMLGEDKANLLGSILVTSFELAAMERVDVPEHKREDFYLFIDEFQNFSIDSFTSILSEARKYRLCLTLSHQYLDQVRENVRKALFGNAGTLISFRVGETDAQALAREYGAGFVPAQFSSLGNFEVMAKILYDGGHIEPFLGKTLSPLPLVGGRRDIIIGRSREKYASTRQAIESKIKKWMG